jgi:hypothetical protein
MAKRTSPSDLLAGAVSFLLLAACASFLHAGPDVATSEEENDLRNRRKVESLITQLRVSDDDGSSEKAKLAERKLLELGKMAFPFLIEHINDREESLRTSAGATPRSLTVGYVCFDIIESQVDLAGMNYKSREGTDGEYHVHRRYFRQFWKDEDKSRLDGLQRWWKEHKKQSLQEMQIEALRWAIAREEKIGFREEEEKKHYLQPLLDKLQKLTSTKSEANPKPTTKPG